MDYSNYKVRSLIEDIKKRWRMRALKQGIALTVLTSLFFGLVYFLMNYRLEIAPLYQTLFMVVASGVILTVVVKFLVLPVSKKLSDSQLAMFVEEKVPGLEDRINSAVEIEIDEMRDGNKNAFIDKLIDDATKKAKNIEIRTVIDRKKERILSYSSNALLFLTALAFFAFFDDLKQIASEIQVAINPLAEFEQDFVDVTPGNVEIEKGESQQILAELKNRTDEDAVLHYKLGEEEWRKIPMQKGLDKPIFSHNFANIQEPIKYFLEIDETKSNDYEISIYEFPKVENIDLTYKYPSYTGIPSRKEEGTGDIRGLKGSNVTLNIETIGTTESGEIVMEDGKTVPLKPAGDGKFTATLKLTDPNSYHIKLTDKREKNNKFPEEYLITPLEDEKPFITILDPQKDLRANPVEEVLMAVNVTDDFGVKDVSLYYSVNGDDEKVVRLAESKAKNKTAVDGNYALYLEDFELVPGDVLTYYFDANDYYHKDDPEATDMYFIEIIPYDTKFTQVNNQGGGGGGGQQRSQPIVEQQRIIAATWKLVKSGNDLSDEQYEYDVNAIKQAQSNLKEQIEERINNTAFSMEIVEDDQNKKITDLLRAATEEMGYAVDELSKPALKKAMNPERKALNKLMRAQALNDEKQVQQQQSQQGGSGGSSEERMTELQDLELDISKDKYEMQQQQQQQQENQEVDEALERLKELAKKQEKLAEQNQRNLQEEEKDERFIDKLKRDQEQLRQEAEDLARQMRQMARNNEQITRQMQSRMDQVTENMKNAEESLKKQEFQKAQAQQQQAVNELEKLRQDLQVTSSDNMREMLDSVNESFQQLKENERQFANDLKETQKEFEKMNARPEKKDIDRLTQKRKDIREQLDSLEDLAKSIEDSKKRENPKIANDLRNLRRIMQDEQIKNDMDRSERMVSQGFLDFADFMEQDIQQGLDKMERQLRRLESELPIAEEEKLNRSLNDARELLRTLDDIKKLSRDGQQNQQNQQGQQQGQQNQQQGQQQGQNKDQQNQQSQQQSQQQGQQQGQQQNQQGQQQGQQQNQQQQGQQQSQQQGQNQQQQNQQQGQQQGGRQQSDQQGQRNQQQQGQQRSMQSQINDARRQVQQMMRDNRDNRELQQQLREVYDNLGKYDFTGVLIGDDADEYFDENIYDPISQLEKSLLDKIDNAEMDKKLYGTRKAEVPPKYKKFVDKYYETIAKTKKKKN